MTDDSNTLPQPASCVGGGMSGTVIGQPRRMEADYEQVKTLLMALRNIRGRIDPKNQLPYISPECRKLLDRRDAPHYLIRTIRALELALEDIEVKLGFFEKCPR